MQESSLHHSLKQHFSGETGQTEVTVDGYQIDVVQGSLLIEIQTGSFSAIKSKLADLLPRHPILLVHPIPVETWLLKYDEGGQKLLERRKSPRRGRWEDLFFELVRIPHLLDHPNLTFEVLLTQQEQVRCNDGRGSWRRKGWSISDHRLLAILERRVFISPDDFRPFLPANLPHTFTTKELSAELNIPTYLAQKMAYSLRVMGLLEVNQRRGRAYLYEILESSHNGNRSHS
jgi:hypothetical protein